MTDSVKFIFKTLIKVPIFIFVAFFILNIFSIAFIYFKMLGLSYVVMQTAVENNYLPDSEVSMILTYLNDISNGIVELKNNGGERFSIKMLVRSQKSIERKLEKLNSQERKDDVITFEELGVDRLLCTMV